MFKSQRLIQTILPAIILLCCGLFIVSCGDDEVTGCMDPQSDNFNAEATVAGDCNYTGCMDPNAENYNANANIEGDCVYARDKFLASFLGTFTCMDPLLSPVLNSDSLVFNITEAVEDDVSKVIFNLVVEGFPIPLEATVDGDKVIVDDKIEGVTIPSVEVIPGLPIDLIADVTGVGEALYNESDDSITGTIEITLDVTSPLPQSVGDICAVFGKKQ